MRRKFALGSAFVVALGVFVSGAGATAPNNEAASYEFHLELPNVAMAPNGDTFAMTGMGTFGVHPKSTGGGGSWTHTFAGGGSVSGTWAANGLVAFQPYGCGVVFGVPLPPDYCGGRVVLDVTLSTPLGPVPAQLTIYCLIGAPPASAAEGIRLVVPGVNNFNKVVEGENVYFKE